ncbi:MAG TPA: hypothetical protein DCR63_05580 [Microbacterium sp.]|nr:hypothetical protein [Microbacterium sp.]
MARGQQRPCARLRRRCADGHLPERERRAEIPSAHGRFRCERRSAHRHRSGARGAREVLGSSGRGRRAAAIGRAAAGRGSP